MRSNRITPKPEEMLRSGNFSIFMLLLLFLKQKGCNHNRYEINSDPNYDQKPATLLRVDNNNSVSLRNNRKTISPVYGRPNRLSKFLPCAMIRFNVLTQSGSGQKYHPHMAP